MVCVCVRACVRACLVDIDIIHVMHEKSQEERC
jgi:hypothetical protein